MIVGDGSDTSERCQEEQTVRVGPSTRKDRFIAKPVSFLARALYHDVEVY